MPASWRVPAAGHPHPSADTEPRWPSTPTGSGRGRGGRGHAHLGVGSLGGRVALGVSPQDQEAQEEQASGTAHGAWRV